jgi:hypothetical protein
LVGGALSSIFPNFQLFTLADTLNAADLPPAGHFFRIAVYALGYVVATCALAVFSFRKREI